MARRRKSKPTNGRRADRQKVRDRFAHAREDAILAGVLPMVPGRPEEALKPERVDPAAQGEQPLPQIARMAIEGDRNGSWKVPDAKKPLLVDEMIELVEASGEDSPPAVVKVMAYNALTKADQLQYERDHPDEAGKAKGGTKVNVGVGVNVRTNVFGDINELIARARERRDEDADAGNQVASPEDSESNNDGAGRQSLVAGEVDDGDPKPG